MLILFIWSPCFVSVGSCATETAQRRVHWYFTVLVCETWVMFCQVTEDVVQCPSIVIIVFSNASLIPFSIFDQGCSWSRNIFILVSWSDLQKTFLAQVFFFFFCMVVILLFDASSLGPSRVFNTGQSNDCFGLFIHIPVLYPIQP